jgi:hypothetical protein
MTEKDFQMTALQLTDFTLVCNAERHPRESRRTRTIGSIAVGILAVGLLACLFAGHLPDPSRCEPGSGQTIITRPVSPQTFTLDQCPPGLKYTIR